MTWMPVDELLGTPSIGFLLNIKPGSNRIFIIFDILIKNVRRIGIVEAYEINFISAVAKNIITN